MGGVFETSHLWCRECKEQKVECSFVVYPIAPAPPVTDTRIGCFLAIFSTRGSVAANSEVNDSSCLCLIPNMEGYHPKAVDGTQEPK